MSSCLLSSIFTILYYRHYYFIFALVGSFRRAAGIQNLTKLKTSASDVPTHSSQKQTKQASRVEIYVNADHSTAPWAYEITRSPKPLRLTSRLTLPRSKRNKQVASKSTPTQDHSTAPRAYEISRSPKPLRLTSQLTLPRSKRNEQAAPKSAPA